jgi:hypothetical protein
MLNVGDHVQHKNNFRKKGTVHRIAEEKKKFEIKLDTGLIIHGLRQNMSSYFIPLTMKEAITYWIAVNRAATKATTSRTCSLKYGACFATQREQCNKYQGVCEWSKSRCLPVDRKTVSWWDDNKSYLNSRVEPHKVYFLKWHYSLVVRDINVVVSIMEVAPTVHVLTLPTGYACMLENDDLHIIVNKVKQELVNGFTVLLAGHSMGGIWAQQIALNLIACHIDDNILQRCWCIVSGVTSWMSRNQCDQLYNKYENRIVHYISAYMSESSQSDESDEDELLYPDNNDINIININQSNETKYTVMNEKYDIVVDSHILKKINHHKNTVQTPVVLIGHNIYIPVSEINDFKNMKPANQFYHKWIEYERLLLSHYKLMSDYDPTLYLPT